MAVVPREMEWTVLFFKNRARRWGKLKDGTDGGLRPGHRCYAARQEAMWERFAEQAAELFHKVQLE
jgi:hypothetical protein